MKAVNLALTIIDLNEYLLSWEIEGDPTGATLTIERSDSPDSEWEVLDNAVSDSATSYLDTSPRTHQKYIPYYYRIQQPDGTYSDHFHLPFEPNRHALQQIHMTKRALQRDVGVVSYYFHKKDYGTRCSECWDGTIKKSTLPDCPTCKGTGFEKGYSDPVKLYVVFPPNMPEILHVGHTKFNILQGMAWTTNYPVIVPGDLILRDDDKELFKVGNQVRRTGLRQYPERQMFQASAIERESVEFDLIGVLP